MKNQVKIWSPATIANLNVGFDALGCALEAPGEEMIVRRTEDNGVVRIARIHGASLDLRADRNVASIAAKSLLESLGNPCGLELEIYKSIQPGSGIGSSAASAAAAVVGVNELLNAGLRPVELIPFALDGEAFASGARHADNVAPALLGGIILSTPEGQVQSIPIPTDWHVTVLHPQIEIRTSDARSVLPAQVDLNVAAQQAAWFASFVSACYEGDGSRAALGLEDVMVGPHRAKLIPFFDEIREIARGGGARAGGISGSGPSTFWISLNTEDAQSIRDAIELFMRSKSMDFKLYSTRIATQGAHLMP